MDVGTCHHQLCGPESTQGQPLPRLLSQGAGEEKWEDREGSAGQVCSDAQPSRALAV